VEKKTNPLRTEKITRQGALKEETQGRLGIRSIQEKPVRSLYARRLDRKRREAHGLQKAVGRQANTVWSKKKGGGRSMCGKQGPQGREVSGSGALGPKWGDGPSPRADVDRSIGRVSRRKKKKVGGRKERDAWTRKKGRESISRQKLGGKSTPQGVQQRGQQNLLESEWERS